MYVSCFPYNCVTCDKRVLRSLNTNRKSTEGIISETSSLTQPG